jgi:hypothetical protein
VFRSAFEKVLLASGVADKDEEPVRQSVVFNVCERRGETPQVTALDGDLRQEARRKRERGLDAVANAEFDCL